MGARLWLGRGIPQGGTWAPSPDVLRSEARSAAWDVGPVTTVAVTRTATATWRVGRGSGLKSPVTGSMGQRDKEVGGTSSKKDVPWGNWWVCQQGYGPGNRGSG